MDRSRKRDRSDGRREPDHQLIIPQLPSSSLHCQLGQRGRLLKANHSDALRNSVASRKSPCRVMSDTTLGTSGASHRSRKASFKFINNNNNGGSSLQVPSLPRPPPLPLLCCFACPRQVLVSSLRNWLGRQYPRLKIANLWPPRIISRH